MLAAIQDFFTGLRFESLADVAKNNDIDSESLLTKWGPFPMPSCQCKLLDGRSGKAASICCWCQVVVAQRCSRMLAVIVPVPALRVRSGVYSPADLAFVSFSSVTELMTDQIRSSVRLAITCINCFVQWRRLTKSVNGKAASRYFKLSFASRGVSSTSSSTKLKSLTGVHVLTLADLCKFPWKVLITFILPEHRK